MIFDNAGYTHELTDDIVIVRVKPGKQNTELMSESIEHLKSMNKHLKILCIPARGTYINKEQRHFLTSEYQKFTKAFAILQEDMLVILTMNMIQKINRPLFPTKAFKKEEDAIEWLNSFD